MVLKPQLIIKLYNIIKEYDASTPINIKIKETFRIIAEVSKKLIHDYYGIKFVIMKL